MSKTQTVTNPGRAQANRDYQDSLRARKRLRTKRAAVHAALSQARAMAKSRKFGTSKNVDKNMEKLGYRYIGDGPDVLQKWGRI